MRKKVLPWDRRSIRTILDDLTKSCKTSAPEDAEDEALKAAARKGEIQGGYLTPEHLCERVGAPFTSVFEDRLLPYRYFTQSLYLQAIRRWKRAVGRQWVKVVASEELIRDPAAVIGEILSLHWCRSRGGSSESPPQQSDTVAGRPHGGISGFGEAIHMGRADSQSGQIDSSGRQGVPASGKGYRRLHALLYVQPPELDDQSYARCFTVLSEEYDRWPANHSVPLGWGQFR